MSLHFSLIICDRSSHKIRTAKLEFAMLYVCKTETTQASVALWRPLVRIYTIEVSHVGTYITIYNIIINSYRLYCVLYYAIFMV